MPQTLNEIRAMLDAAGLAPQKAFGQNFLIDANLLTEVVRLANIRPDEAVLEIGPGTGALTDELLAAGARVLAVEIDRGLAALLGERYAGNERFQLHHGDVLAGKRRIAPEVIAQAARLASQSPYGTIKLVANLPYNIATPLVCELLILSDRARRGVAPDSGEALAVESITATVQREAAERLACGPETPSQYGPAAILATLLARPRRGKLLPPEAFWPRPKVTSQIIQLDCGRAAGLNACDSLDAETLQNLAAGCFAQRRKKIRSAGNRLKPPLERQLWLNCLTEADVDPDSRPENIPPAAYAALAAAWRQRREA